MFHAMQNTNVIDSCDGTYTFIIIHLIYIHLMNNNNTVIIYNHALRVVFLMTVSR